MVSLNLNWLKCNANNTGDAIIGLSYNAMNFTLSCVTSGGIATFVDGDNCLSPKQELVGYSQQLLDPLATRYNTALTWNSQSQGNYICSTRSTTAISYAVLLTEFGAGKTQMTS